jgi:branched-chain amino acid transport system permease protein
VIRTATFLLCAVLISALVALPLATDVATQSVLAKMLIASLFATGFSLLAGHAGLLSFGHAAFYGIGAVATMHVMIWVEQHSAWYIPTPLLPLAGGLAGAVLATIAGYFAARRSGSYFTLITLAMAELIHVVAMQWHSVFGGEAGLTSMRQPWAGISFDTPLQVYYCVLFWVMLCTLLAWLFTRTAFGRLTVAIRENEERVLFLGYNVHLSKVAVFGLSGLITGIAGGLLAMATESASYTLFGPFVSLEVVLHTFIGGAGLFLGPAFAAAILTYLPFILSDITRLWPLYQGIIFMLLMLYAPSGVAGMIQTFRSRMPVAPTGTQVTYYFVLTSGLAFMATGFIFAAEVTHQTAASAPSGLFMAFLKQFDALAGASIAVLRASAWAAAALSVLAGLLILWWAQRLCRVSAASQTGIPNMTIQSAE